MWIGTFHYHIKFPWCIVRMLLPICCRSGRGLQARKNFLGVLKNKLLPFPRILAKISIENWNEIITWSLKLNWKLSDELQTSWIEVSCCAYFQGLNLSEVPSTPQAFATLILKVANQLSKLRPVPKIFPGFFRKACKANGKTHPIGLIQGAELHLPLKARKFLAVQMLHGKTHVLKDWCFPFPVG